MTFQDVSGSVGVWIKNFHETKAGKRAWQDSTSMTFISRKFLSPSTNPPKRYTLVPIPGRFCRLVCLMAIDCTRMPRKKGLILYLSYLGQSYLKSMLSCFLVLSSLFQVSRQRFPCPCGKCCPCGVRSSVRCSV